MPYYKFMSPDFLLELSHTNDRYKLFLEVCQPQEKAPCIAALQCQNIPIVDVGHELATYTSGLTSVKYLVIDGSEYLKKLLHSRRVKLYPSGNDIVAIHNLGILMEPAFGIDPVRWIQEFSKNVSTLIIWENQVDTNEVLHWPTRNQSRTLNFSNTPFKKFTYEV